MGLGEVKVNHLAVEQRLPTTLEIKDIKHLHPKTVLAYINAAHGLINWFVAVSQLQNDVKLETATKGYIKDLEKVLEGQVDGTM